MDSEDKDVTAPKPIFRRALILEDLAPAAAWLEKSLQLAFPGIQVDIAVTRKEARDCLRDSRYQLALVDLALPDGSGLDIITIARAMDPPVYVVVTTVFDDPAHVFPALRMGAQGYLLKDGNQEEIVQSLRAIIQGRPPLSPSIATAVLGYFSAADAAKAHLIAELTEREREVLAAVAQGLTVSAAAQRLGITHNTAATYVKRIYSKLNVSTRAQATLLAAQFGIVSHE